MRTPDQTTELILGEAIAIHRELGPRLLESAYESILADALEMAGARVQRQLVVPLEFRGKRIADGFRLDLLVDGVVVVECKSVDKLAPVHAQQLLTYLRLGGFPIGLLLNFGESRLVDGVKRLVNNYQPPPDSVLRLNQPLSA